MIRGKQCHTLSTALFQAQFSTIEIRKKYSVLTLLKRLPSHCARIALRCTNDVQFAFHVFFVMFGLHSTGRCHLFDASATEVEFFAAKHIKKRMAKLT